MPNKPKKVAKTPRAKRKKVQTADAKQPERRPKRVARGEAGKTESWRRRYYIPDYSIQRAGRDLIGHSLTEETEDFAGRMFALQDLIDNDDLDNISAIEQESDSPFFLAIADAVRKEARTGDPEYARSIAGEFLEQAFRQDPPTVRLWDKYENRIRRRRIDAGLGFIEPPDPRYDSDPSATEDRNPAARRNPDPAARPDSNSDADHALSGCDEPEPSARPARDQSAGHESDSDHASSGRNASDKSSVLTAVNVARLEVETLKIKKLKVNTLNLSPFYTER